MKQFKIHSSLFILICITVNLCAVQTELAVSTNSSGFWLGNYANRVWKDIKSVPAKPLSWDKNDWLIAGAFVGGSIACFTVDNSIRKYYETHKSRTVRELSNLTNDFGSDKYQVPLIGGIWLGAIIIGDPTLHKITADSVEASLISAGLITPLIKYCAGRARPDTDQHTTSFRPFVPGRESFPSGHTTEAFAMAAVLDQDLRKDFGYWQTPILYTIALGTANSRLYYNEHFLSDVVMGAGIGWSVGYWISNKTGTQTVFLQPTQDGARLGFRF